MDSIALILIIIGILLLIAEIFIPSFGVTGIIGIVFLLAGVIVTADTFVGGLIMFIVILLFTIVVMILLYRLVASKRSPLILKESVNEDVSDEQLTFFIGKEGKAVTPLRPAGSVDIDGVRLDVLTRGEFIEKEADVIVDAVDGKKLYVRVKK